MGNFSSDLGGALITQNFTVASNKLITSWFFFVAVVVWLVFFFSQSLTQMINHSEVIHSSVIFAIESELLQCSKVYEVDVHGQTLILSPIFPELIKETTF